MNGARQAVALLVILVMLLIGLFFVAAFFQRERAASPRRPDSTGQTGGGALRETPVLSPPIAPTSTIPESFILGGPAENERFEFKEVSFRFTGAALGVETRDLRFETKLEGVDGDWVEVRGSERTIRLPAGARSYTFLVRARTPQNVVDQTPASRTFFANLSPLLGQVSLEVGSASSVGEQATLRNNDRVAVDVSGWRIRSRKEESIVPQAATLFYYGIENLKGSIRLQPGETLTLYTGPGNLGDNLKLNKCVGYLNSTPVNPKFPGSCPRFSRWEYGHLSQVCQDFIGDLRACQIPNPNEPKLLSEPECRQWLVENANYNACVRTRQRDVDFYSREWRAWLGVSRFIYNRTHDNIRLYDAHGQLVDRRDY